MTAIAHLPMYDFPEVRDATDAFWQAVAMRLREGGLDDVPPRLSREYGHRESWLHPHLLLGQSCGYPAMHEFRGAFRIVATPCFVAAGCGEGTHRSVIVVAAESRAGCIVDLRGLRFALNSFDSNTGMNLARLAVAPFACDGRFFGEIVETGAHAASLAAVAEGAADAAAIDCVTHALIARHRPHLAAATRILAWTAASPALPFVTALAASEATIHLLREALAGALADPSLSASREALFLAGVSPADDSHYQVLLDYEEQARRLGYPRLC